MDNIKPNQMQLLGQGGEHWVYSYKDDQELVLKFSIMSIKQFARHNQQAQVALDELTSKNRKLANKLIKQDTYRFSQMAQYFPKTCLLPQKKYLIKVPITEEMRLLLTKEDLLHGEQTCWAIVTVQQRSSHLNNPKRVSLASGYAEDLQPPKGIYRQLNQRYFFNQYSQRPFHFGSFISIQRSKHLIYLLSLAANDQIFHAFFSNLVALLIQYCNETRELLDLAPLDNLIIFEHESQWRYLLVDAMYPIIPKMLEEFKQFLEAHQILKTLTHRQQQLLKAGLNIIRMLNGVAQSLNLKERIDIVPKPMKKNPPDFLTLFSANTA